MKKILSILTVLTMVLSFAAVPVSAENYALSNVNGWTKSNWNIPDADHTAGIDIVNSEDTANTIEIPSGDNMLKIWAGAPTNYPNLNANAVQQVTGLTVGDTYVLTGKVRYNSNATYIYLGNTNFNNGAQIQLDAYLGQDKRGVWNDLSITFVPSNPTVELRFTAGANRNIHIDNLSIKKVETDSEGVTRYSEELLVNGDFEKNVIETATADTSKKLTGVDGWSNSQWYVANGKKLDAEVVFLTDIIGTPEGRGMLKLRAGGATGDYDGVNARAVQKIDGLDTSKSYILTGKVKASANNTFVKLANATCAPYSQSAQGIQIIGSLGFANGVWGDLNIEFTPTSSSVELSFKAQANRTMWLDKLSVKEIEKDSDGNIVKYGEELLVNGNFEDSFKTGMTAGKYTLSDVAGWDVLSNWNIPSDGYEAGIDLLENIAGAPEGNNMLKLWTGKPTGAANLNANAVQQIKLDKEKTYRLTGKVKYNSNDTYIYLGNTTFNDGKQMQLKDHFGDGKNGIWNDLSIDFKPSNVSVELRFTVAANRIIWLDALSVKEVLFNAEGEEIGLGDTEYLINGNFEGAEIVVPVFEATKAFYPADGEEILDLTAQQNITEMIDTYGVNAICARAAVKNTKYDTKRINVYLAIYEGDVLYDVVMTTSPITKSDEVQNVDVFYTLPSDLTNAVYSCKLFVWDADMIPTGECGEITE